MEGLGRLGKAMGTEGLRHLQLTVKRRLLDQMKSLHNHKKLERIEKTSVSATFWS